MGYLVRWTSKEGIKTELAFSGRHAKEDAIAHAKGAIEEGRDVELLDNGKPVPRSEYAPEKRKART